MPFRPVRPLAFALLLLPLGCMTSETPDVAQQAFLPAMRWDHRPEADDWTAATLAALRAEGAVLASTVPADIDAFCPNYADASMPERRAFWAGSLFGAGQA